MNCECILHASALLAFSALQCTPVAEEKTAYSVEKIREFRLTLPENSLVGQVFDLAIDEQEWLYLSDKIGNTVWVVDGEGRFVTKIGSEGPGPGELAGPTSIALKNDTLAVLEARNQRISFFRKNGNYLGAVPVGSGHISGLEIGPQGELFVSESSGYRQYFVYDRSGKRISALREQDLPPVMLPVRLAGGHISLTSAGTILYASIRHYEVVELDWQGDTLRTFTAMPPGYEPPNLKAPELLNKQEQWALLRVPLQCNETVVVQWSRRKGAFANAGTATWEHFVDLYSREGNHLQLSLPVPRTFIAHRNGFLYTIDDSALERGESNPVVAVYKIVEKTNSS